MSIDQQTALEALVAECEAANHKTLSQLGVGVIDLNAIARAKAAFESDPSTIGWPEYVAGIVVAYLGGGVDDERIKPIAGIIARRMWAIPKADAPVAEPVAPIGYMSPNQVPLIVDCADESGVYIPMRRTPKSLFTLALYTRPPAPEEDKDAALPEGVVISAYRFSDRTVIQRIQQMEGQDLWAVRNVRGDVLNVHGEWESEPLLSRRDAAFVARCRFTTSGAALAAALAQGDAL